MENESVPRVHLYTKGHSTPQILGAWAYVLTMPDNPQARKSERGSKDKASHNEMEIVAATNGLRQLKRPCHVTIFSNSAYLLGGVLELVEGHPPYATNPDAWEQFQSAALDHLIECVHIQKAENTDDMRVVDSMALNLLPPDGRR